AALMCAFLGTGLSTIDDITADSLFWAAAGLVALGTARRPIPAGEVPTRRARAKSAGRRDSPRGSVIVAYACVAAGIVLLLSTSNAFAASRLTKVGQDSRLIG